jgi:hypothetical protein
MIPKIPTNRRDVLDLNPPQTFHDLLNFRGIVYVLYKAVLLNARVYLDR